MAAKTTIKRKKPTTPKNCYFCTEKKDPQYTDVSVLQRFTTDRGKIVPSSRSGICSIHQRKLAEAIKHARHLALLPFVQRD